MPSTKPFSSLEPWKPWWRYRWPYALEVAYGRFHNRRPRPIFRARMMWQRARRGWSIEDSWSFDYYMADVIAGGVRSIRERGISHPGELTPERWDEILLEIEQGMAAARRIQLGEDTDWNKDLAQFRKAMDHLKEWWFGIWD